MSELTTNGYRKSTPEDQIVVRGPEGYGRCPRSLLRNANLSVQARWLWTALEDMASPESEMPFPKQETLAEWAGVTVRSVQRWITELEEAGRLVSHQRGLRRSNLYELVWPGYEARPDTTSVSSLDTTSMSPLDTTPVSHEAEPLEAEPKEATTPPTPQGGIEVDFDRWWHLLYPAKTGGRARALKAYRRAVRASSVEQVECQTINYAHARNLFAANVLMDKGLIVEAPIISAPAFLNTDRADFDTTPGFDELMARWQPVIWQAEKARGPRSPQAFSAAELAALADAR